MIRHSKILLVCIAVTLCISALAIFPVSAGHGADADGDSVRAQQMEQCLVLLEEQGIDVTELQTAFASGDRKMVHLLLGELRDEGIIGVDERHDVESGDCESGRDRTGETKRREQIEEHIEMIEENGVDVTDIRTAFVRGDMATVRALLADLHEEHPPE